MCSHPELPVMASRQTLRSCYRQGKTPRPVGRGADTPQSKTCTKASPTSIERKQQRVAVYDPGLGMTSFPFLCLVPEEIIIGVGRHVNP